MELETNLSELSSSSWISNLTRKRIMLIGTSILVATAVCISIIVAVSVNSSSSKSSLTFGAFSEKMNLLKNDFEWVPYSSQNYSLVDAFSGGTGVNGKTIYLCRARHMSNTKREEEVIPGTFDPTNSVCKVPYADLANSHDKFDLLVTKNPSRLAWVKDFYGNLKTGAVSGGQTAYQEELYVTQFEYYGYSVLGKLHMAHKKASGPADGKERYRESYNLLCVVDYAL